MKTQLQKCSNCNEETIHDVGKKQATTKSSAYTRRSTSRCRQCGDREIVNRKTGRRVLKGHNTPSSSEANK